MTQFDNNFADDEAAWLSDRLQADGVESSGDRRGGRGASKRGIGAATAGGKRFRPRALREPYAFVR